MATQATDAGVRAVAVAVALGVVRVALGVVTVAVAVVPVVRADRVGTAGMVPAGAAARAAAAAMDAVEDMATVTPVAGERTGVAVAGHVAPARPVVRAVRVQGVTGRPNVAIAAGRTAPSDGRDGTLTAAPGAISGAAPAVMPAVPDVTVNPAADADHRVGR